MFCHLLGSKIHGNRDELLSDEVVYLEHQSELFFRFPALRSWHRLFSGMLIYSHIVARNHISKQDAHFFGQLSKLFQRENGGNASFRVVRHCLIVEKDWGLVICMIRATWAFGPSLHKVFVGGRRDDGSVLNNESFDVTFVLVDSNRVGV